LSYATGILCLDLRQILEKIATNWNFLADRAKLDHGLTVIKIAHSPSETLVLSSSDENLFAPQGILSSFVHSCHSSATSLLLMIHVLGAKNLDVSCLLNEKSISLLESFVPEKDDVFVKILDNTLATLVDTIYDLYDIVIIDGVSLGINRLLLCLEVSLIKSLADLVSSDIAHSTFFIDQSNQIRTWASHRVHRENNCHILVVVIGNKISSTVRSRLCLVHEVGRVSTSSTLLNLCLDLEVVGSYLDLSV
jgi:hypothetical protein